MTTETQLDDARLANATLREKWRQTIVERDELQQENERLEGAIEELMKMFYCKLCGCEEVSVETRCTECGSTSSEIVGGDDDPNAEKKEG